jgi:WD40 repeat protein/transcriptional regulator with XRE-family HTH domain
MPQHFPEQLRRLRLAKGWSQEELAAQLNCSPRTTLRWENGRSTPHPELAAHLAELFGTTQKELGLRDVAGFRKDMTETPDTAPFCGREDDVELVVHWITHDRCRLVALLGLGGVGKTMLAAAIVEEVEAEFPRVFWRSLQNEQRLEDILKACLQFLLPEEQWDASASIHDQVSRLIVCLQEQRCLLVLDNLETILQPAEHLGQYRPGFENYATFFRRLGEVEHQSCILLTSREAPGELAFLADPRAKVRLWQVQGLRQEDSRTLLEKRTLQGSDAEWQAFIAHCSGIPLALKLAASSVETLCGGQLGAFLAKPDMHVGNIHQLIQNHFQRLSAAEQELLYWLAIEREAQAAEVLRKNLIRAPGREVFWEALESLRKRSLVESVTVEREARFYLQPVILEYITAEFVACAARAFQEFVEAPIGGMVVPSLWQHFAFLKAQASDYVRQVQVRLILHPLTEQLLSLVDRETLREQFARLLARQRLEHVPHNYLAGNVLNVLVYLQIETRDFDCSEVVVRQAYLQNAQLAGLNLSRATFEETVFTNVFGDILAVAFSPSGAILAAGTATGAIWLYRVADGAAFFTYREHSDSVWALAFSPDGRWLASSGDDGLVQLWDTESRLLHQTFTRHQGRVRAVAFSPDGRWLASGSNDRLIYVWDVVSGEVVKTLRGHENWVWSVAFHPAGHILASGGADHTVRLWDLIADEPTRVLSGHTDRVRAVVFHPTGRYLASASDDRTVRLWDLEQERSQVLQGHTNRVWTVAFERSGERLASGGEDCTMCLWETATGNRLHTVKEHVRGVRALAFSSTGLLASGSDDQTIRFWDGASGHGLRTFQGYVNRIRTMALVPQSGYLVSANDDQTLSLWHVETGACVQTLPTPGQRVLGLAVSPREPLLASVGNDQMVRLWNVQTRQQTRVLRGHTDWVRGVAFSQDGALLASGGEDKVIYLWNVRSGQPLRQLLGHTSTIRVLAFGAEPRLLVSGGDDASLRLWDTTTGSCLREFIGHTHPVRALIWDTARSLLYSASEDQTIKIWNSTTGACLQTLSGHTSHVLDLDLHPGAAQLVSCGDDLSLRFWDVSNVSATQAHALAWATIEQAHESRVRAVVYSADGKMLASSSDDGSILLWDTATLTRRAELFSTRPYEGMSIAGARGLSGASREALLKLGAVEI